jgi:hypothetical protein
MKREYTTVLIASLALTACGEARGGEAAAPAAEPRQLIVGVDLSASQSDGRRAEARKALDLVVDELQYGDRIVLLQVHQRGAAEDDAARWAETVPLPREPDEPTSVDRERLDAVKQAARSVAETMFAHEAAGHLPTTDILSTLHIAAEYMRDAGSRATTIVLLSDMLQSANGIEMARAGGTPGARWIEQQQISGVLPRLEGACVAVIGADATTPSGITVRDFWQKYLEAAGAVLHEDNYRLIATDRSALRC